MLYVEDVIRFLNYIPRLRHVLQIIACRVTGRSGSKGLIQR